MRRSIKQLYKFSLHPPSALFCPKHSEDESLEHNKAEVTKLTLFVLILMHAKLGIKKNHQIR